MIRSFLVFTMLMIAINLSAQSQSLLYNQYKNPQALMSNPGMRYQETDMHIGIPFLSNIQLSFTNSAFSVADIFNDQDINQNIDRELSELDSDDYLQFNEKIDLINIGWHKNKYYFTAGFYQESHASANYPKDLLQLIYYGNSSVNRTYDLDGLAGSLNAQGVFHFGINKAVNKKLYIGGRFKLYSSTFNAHTRNNKGTFLSQTTDQPAVLEQRIQNLDVYLKSAGFDQNSQGNETDFNPSDLFTGDNFGAGIDFGFSYQVSRRTEITGSIIDLGFIAFSSNTKNLRLNGSYNFEGVELIFPDFDQGDSIIDYYEELRAEIDEEITDETTTSSYIYAQPTKLNLGWSYRFGGIEACDCPIDQDRIEGNQEIGAHFFAANYPGSVRHFLNFYYQRSFWDRFNIRLISGVAQLERFNFGLGVSARFKGYSFFLNADTLRYADNFYFAKDIAVQGGMSIML